MSFKIIYYGWRNTKESIVEVVVEDTCGNQFKGMLKLQDSNIVVDETEKRE